MNKTRMLVFGAVIAAVYITVSLLLLPVAYGPLQFRASEALTTLPFAFPAAVPGLFVGCVIINFYSPMGIADVVFGGSATLISALLTRWIGVHIKNRKLGLFLAPLPPVVINAIIIGLEISVFSTEGFTAVGFLIYGSQVFISQLVVCYCLGLPLLLAMEKIWGKKENSTKQ